MGGCLSVSLSCDQVVNQVSQWICLKESYIRELTENLGALEKAMGVLKAKRDDVQRRVDREEYTGHHQRLAQVQVWLTSIQTTENQFNDLVSTSELELQRLCLCGFCSKDFKSSYRYGKKVYLMLREVESLGSQGEFNAVTEAAPIAQVEELPIQPTIVGQDTMLVRVWNRLMDDNVGIMGLYGMGGVGKTTLLKQVNNKFLEIGGRFDIVIWVVVSKNATVHKIQEGIGEKLGLARMAWGEKNENQRAIDIHNVLRRKKFVLMLDDVWEKMGLDKIGVPYPNRENRCKVVFTTRSRDVCGRMGVDDPIKVSCLGPDEAWDLFKKKVGENTLESHPDIPRLARKVAKKCRGLPLALNVIGETMSCKSTVQEWNRAIDLMSSSATEFSGMEDEILPILKYSYDSLNGEQVKSCFLYCSLFPEDYPFGKEELVEYWIGEGFLDEKDGRERALNQGYDIIGSLIRACLLLEGAERKSDITMHDVVREMALWIASDLGKHKERCIVQAGVGLREVPKVNDWRTVKRMSLMNNEVRMLSGRLDCPQLTTLLLGLNRKLVTISDEFFQSMPRLLVLDLSWNTSFSGLPEQISGLVSLRYLSLSWTKIKRLPIGLQALKMLIHLNLEGTSQLERLQGISNLSSLRILKLRHSRVWLDMNLMRELQLLEHLEFVSISMTSGLVGEQLVYDPKMARCIQQVFITEHPGEAVSVLILPAMDNLYELFIQDGQIQEIELVKTPWNKSLTRPCFSNLFDVHLAWCDCLKDLTWLLFAPNLTRLAVVGSQQLEDIISKEKASRVLEETGSILPFQKLEVLSLVELPELKSIYWMALPLQRLSSLKLGNCPKLRKLPLNSKSVFKVEDFIIESTEREWIERVEWEDEATRQRFLPSFKLTTMRS